jgi:hypothetical protein
MTTRSTDKFPSAFAGFFMPIQSLTTATEHIKQMIYDEVYHLEGAQMLARGFTGLSPDASPDEASALSVVIDHSIQAIEIHDLAKRITALEETQAKRDETKDPTTPA